MSLDVQPLSRILGQDAAVTALRALASADDPVPPLLLHGPPGVGKRASALSFAAALVCGAPKGTDACGACGPCSRIAEADRVTDLRARSTAQESARTYPDAGLVSIPGRKTRISVLQARDIAQSLVTRPFELSRRIYVVDPADRMTEAAANAMLKTLEEPPPWAVLALVTSAPWRLPITVRSRLRPVRFRPLGDGVVRTLLERQGFDADDAASRAALSHGNVERAASLDPEAERTAIDLWVSVLAALRAPERAPALAARAGDALGGTREDASRALALLVDVLRDVVVAGRGGAPRVLDGAQVARAAEAPESVSGPWTDGPRLVDALAREVDVFHRNPRLAIEGAVLGLAGLLRPGDLLLHR